MNMKKALVILLVLAAVVVATGSRYSSQIVVDRASYTLPVDPNDPIFTALRLQGDPAIYNQWVAQFGATERTKLIYDVSFNREIVINLAQRVISLEARVTALEPVKMPPLIDPNAAPITPEDLGGTFVPLDELPPEMRD